MDQPEQKDVFLQGALTEEEQKEEKTLKLTYWYVTHKLLLRRILVGALVVFSALCFAYTIWGLLDYFVFSYDKHQQLLRDLVNSRTSSQEWLAEKTPQTISVGNVYVFNRGDKFDLLTEINNDSLNYWAEFTYRFTYAGGVSEDRKSFILPNEERWLAELALVAVARPSSAQLEITNISWHRLNPKEIANYEAWKGEHLNLKLSTVAYEPNISLNKGSVAKSRFNVQNLSAYGYRNIGFYIIAYRGATPAAVDYVVLDNLASGERREVEVSWFEALTQLSKIEVSPVVNLLDDNNFMPV